MLAISLYPYIHNIPIGRLHAGSPCLHMFFTSLCFGTMPKPKGQTKVLVFSLIYWCACVCVCCHCLAYFAVFYVISRLTYWFQCAPSPVSCSELSKFARRRPALGGPAWLILVPTLGLVLDLVLVLVAILTAATRTTAFLPLLPLCRCNRLCGCNIIEIDIVHMRRIAATAPLIGATRRVPLRVSATISGIYCLASRMQIGQHWRPNQSTCQAICHSGSSAPNAANCDRLSMPSILIWAQ